MAEYRIGEDGELTEVNQEGSGSFSNFAQGLFSTYANARITDLYGPKPVPYSGNAAATPGQNGQPVMVIGGASGSNKKWFIIGGVALAAVLVGVVLMRRK